MPRRNFSYLKRRQATCFFGPPNRDLDKEGMWLNSIISVRVVPFSILDQSFRYVCYTCRACIPSSLIIFDILICKVSPRFGGPHGSQAGICGHHPSFRMLMMFSSRISKS